MKKSRKMVLLLLPLLITYLFQATQYARAPVKYNYYIVYAKNADIALLPGTDRSPENNDFLLRNATNQQGLYNLSLGEWAPGYRINYTDAFHIKNNEAFAVILMSFNFSSEANGTDYLAVYMKNDTDGDGIADGNWIAVYLGSETWPPNNGNQLSASNYIYLAANMQGNASKYIPVKLEIKIREDGITGLTPGTPSLRYSGTMYLWFTSRYS